MNMNHMSSYQNAAGTKVRFGRLMILLTVAFLIGFTTGCVSGYVLKSYITVRYGTETSKPINYQEKPAERDMKESE